MEARRQFHGHHGRRGGGGRGGGGRFHGGRGGRGGRGGGGAVWFKSAGYNDYEVVSIAEEVVGISGFLDEHQPGFSGAIKQRFSDFVVHEMSSSGRRVELSALAKRPKTAPSAFHDLVLAFAGIEAPPKLEKGQQPAAKSGNELVDVVRELTKKLQRVAGDTNKLAHASRERYNLRKLVSLVAHEIGDKKGVEFEEFLAKIEEARAKFELEKKDGDEASTTARATEAAEGLTFYIGGLNDKTDRVFIHESMRRYGGSRIVADTLNIGGDTSVIRVRPAFAAKLLPGERDARRDWPVGQPDYLQFTLYKRNKDTTVVLNQLATSLKVPVSHFSYADAKDKRGISTQLCTVYRVTKERALHALRPNPTRALGDHQHLVGDLRYTHHKLQIGDCRGNHFALAVRALADETSLSEKDVTDAVRQWQSLGFINFFGLQRFGNASTSFHLIGRAMLRKDFKLAVLLLLRPQEGEASKIREAREHFRQHKDVAAALRMLPPFLVSERAILEGLQQHGVEAYELAFRSISKPIRVAYVEAYQNYVWNEMASLRMSKKFDSTVPVVGDLVVIESSEERPHDAPPPRKKFRKTLTRRVVHQQVAVLTEETVKQYRIEDVVLPVPGHAVEYPTHDVGAAYKKLLTTDCIDFGAHFEPDGSQVYALDGYYRPVVQKPRNVSFKLETYTDPTIPLIPTDVDRLIERTPALAVAAVPPSGAATDGKESKDAQSSDEPKPTQRALVLDFELGYGSDATVALRELMKQSSSVHVSWQNSGGTANTAPENGTTSGEATGKAKQSAKPAAGAAKKGGKPEPRKVITAQKKSQVAIGRPGFSLGRS